LQLRRICWIRSRPLTLLDARLAQSSMTLGSYFQQLQRVVAKDGEGRLALAALYWSDHQKAQAETVLGDACVSLEQLYNRMDGAAAATAAETLYKYIIVEHFTDVHWYGIENRLFDHQRGRFQSYKKSGIHPTYRATRYQSLGF
jgi:hypothetical protein